MKIGRTACEWQCSVFALISVLNPFGCSIRLAAACIAPQACNDFLLFAGMTMTEVGVTLATSFVFFTSFDISRIQASDSDRPLTFVAYDVVTLRVNFHAPTESHALGKSIYSISTAHRVTPVSSRSMFFRSRQDARVVLFWGSSNRLCMWKHRPTRTSELIWFVEMDANVNQNSLSWRSNKL